MSDHSKRFKVEAFLVIVDHLTAALAALNQWLNTYQLCSVSWEDSKRWEAVISCWGALPRITSENLESDLSAELTHFAKFVSTSSVQKLQELGQGGKTSHTGVKSSCELDMYLLLHELQLMQTFPNAEIMLRMYLLMMVTNCTGEWTFCKWESLRVCFAQWRDKHAWICGRWRLARLRCKCSWPATVTARPGADIVGRPLVCLCW